MGKGKLKRILWPIRKRFSQKDKKNRKKKEKEKNGETLYDEVNSLPLSL